MADYIIAVRREHRSRLPGGWPRVLAEIEGVRLVGAARPHRLQIEANDRGVEEVRRRFGDICHIEKTVGHRIV